MEFVLATYGWVIAHAVELGVAVAAVHTAAVAIVNLTPTPKDNEIVASVYRVVEFAAGILSIRAKQ
jgi:hypothetical protein